MTQINDYIKWYDIVDSTNNIAFERGEIDIEKTTYAALFQTAGRGQKGNSWKSNKGENLTFTILLKPQFVLPQDQYIISIITTLGITDYLKEKISGKKIKIKWPNDIYVEDKKICGILIEHSIGGEGINHSIVGIGLNLNQSSFPNDLLNPTSVLLESGKKLEIKTELPNLLDKIFTIYDSYRSDRDYNSLYDRYISNLYRYGEIHKFIELNDISADKTIPTYFTSNKVEKEGKIIEGKIVGINRQSCIEIELISGEKRSYSFKEIGYII